MDEPTKAQLQSILNSPEAKKLLEILRKDGGATAQKAAAAANNGNYGQAMQLLAPILNGSNAQDIASFINDKFG